jgi:hypothetical protein
MPGWLRRLSLRGRLILIGSVGLAAGLLLGGLLLVTVVHLVLVRAVDTSTRRTAADIAAVIDAGGPGDRGVLADPIATAGTQYVQVLDGQHRILAASVGADRLRPLLHDDELARATSGQIVVVDADRIGLVGRLRVAVQEASQGRTVLVGASDADVESSAHTVRDVLLVAYPLLVATLAFLAWHVVGWALAPVEASTGAPRRSVRHQAPGCRYRRGTTRCTASG